MINGINIGNYYKMVQMNQALNSYMSKIAIAKAQISRSISSTISSPTGNNIGRNIDIYA